MLDKQLLVNNIKNLCHTNNINISQLEKQLQFGAGIISRWTKADPSLSKIIDIASFFSVSVDELIGYKSSYEDKQEINLINTLYERTINCTLNWKIYDKNNISQDDDAIFSDDILQSHTGYSTEVYYAKYQNGYFIVKSTFLTINHLITDMEIFLYIKPDEKSEPVQYSDWYKWLDPLWKYIRLQFFGTLSEVKAEEFANSFLTNTVSEDANTPN